MDTVKLLVSNKADVKIKNRGEEITGNFEIVKFLLSKGTDVNIKDINKFGGREVCERELWKMWSQFTFTKIMWTIHIH